jgi:hypothetical protein
MALDSCGSSGTGETHAGGIRRVPWSGIHLVLQKDIKIIKKTVENSKLFEFVYSQKPGLHWLIFFDKYENKTFFTAKKTELFIRLENCVMLEK